MEMEMNGPVGHFYLHVAVMVGRGGRSVKTRRPVASFLRGGTATGTHIHIARKYNGEWLPAEGWRRTGFQFGRLDAA